MGFLSILTHLAACKASEGQGVAQPQLLRRQPWAANRSVFGTLTGPMDALRLWCLQCGGSQLMAPLRWRAMVGVVVICRRPSWTNYMDAYATRSSTARHMRHLRGMVNKVTTIH